jgi:circadian clock protein KaiB
MSDEDAAERFSDAIRKLDDRRYLLRLYVVGATPGSQRAISNLRAICETELAGRYELEVIDIYQQPALAEGEQIVAAPTLVKELPLPVRRLVGDMSDRDHVLIGLDLRPVER